MRVASELLLGAKRGRESRRPKRVNEAVPGTPSLTDCPIKDQKPENQPWKPQIFFHSREISDLGVELSLFLLGLFLILVIFLHFHILSRYLSCHFPLSVSSLSPSLSPSPLRGCKIFLDFSRRLSLKRVLVLFHDTVTIRNFDTNGPSSSPSL